jgi:hypothetical protein
MRFDWDDGDCDGLTTASWLADTCLVRVSISTSTDGEHVGWAIEDEERTIVDVDGGEYGRRSTGVHLVRLARGTYTFVTEDKEGDAWEPGGRFSLVDHSTSDGILVGTHNVSERRAERAFVVTCPTTCTDCVPELQEQCGHVDVEIFGGAHADEVSWSLHRRWTEDLLASAPVGAHGPGSVVVRVPLPPGDYFATLGDRVADGWLESVLSIRPSGGGTVDFGTQALELGGEQHIGFRVECP